MMWFCYSLRAAWRSSAQRDGRHFSRIAKQTEERQRVSDLLAALKDANKSRDLEKARKIHADAVASKDDKNIYVASSLVRLFSKCGSMVDARNVFDKIPRPNVVSWTSLISGYVLDGKSEVALDMFSRMQTKGCAPDAQTFAAALKACTGMAAKEEGKLVKGRVVKPKALQTGIAIHSQVKKSSCDADVILANTLIDFYTKCGSMAEAKEVFDGIQKPDVVSWTSLILGYAQNGEGQVALDLYQDMKSSGCSPNGQTFLAALKACTDLAAKEESSKVDGSLLRVSTLAKGREIHSEATKNRFDSDIFVANTLIDMYAKCGSMTEAMSVFERIPRRAVVSWNALMLGYVHNGQAEVTFRLFERMRSEGCAPNGQTFVAALKACSGLAAKEEGEQVDSKVVKVWSLQRGIEVYSAASKCGFDSDIYVANTAVDMYAKCGSMRHAREVFEKILHPDVISWTALVSGFAQNGEGGVALEYFERMQAQGCPPNGQTYVAALKACIDLATNEDAKLVEGKLVKAGSLEKGEDVHSQAAKRGYESDIFVASALIDMYSKCGSMASAREVFNGMKRRDAVVWNALMLGFALNGASDEALELFTLMQSQGCDPDAQTFAAALKACSSFLSEDGKADDERTKRALEKASLIHSQAAKFGFDTDIFVASMLVDLYARCGSMREARQVFERIPRKKHNVVSWTTLIAGYAQNDEPEDALELFQRMLVEGFAPNAQTFLAALKACGSLAALAIGKAIHSTISRYGAEGVASVSNTLVLLYGKCGSITGAEQVFYSTTAKDVVTWNALMASYGHLGDTAALFRLSQQMLEEGLKPDGITFNFILTACSHAGLVDKGKHYFQAMSSSEYGVTPDLEHYHCMVDLLGRGNKLDEAVEMAKTMPFKPSVITWTTILAASRKWKNVAAGKLAFDELLSLNEKQAASYVLMANIYAAAGMWEEKAKVHAMRKDAKAWKKPGQSWWTDERGIIHKFVAGDRTHAQRDEIGEKLKLLEAAIKDQGYVADVGAVAWDIPDEDKEESLCGHSERLAIACALVNSPAGTTIRIGKNLRVCEDCHKATGFISKVEKRVIVCRDASRFHVFEDGKCSCGDFW
ncbi:putative pentatricopeptide repeat-containing protein At3g13770, mitochondrial [Selaginella moellendorffii]|uniref:putative pentatricopeptide repeat-containing protein At3g13770, mitochondrial n=1 Tax=Selaginella moellendorffii TaxID=88036 RepID=UPI000D1C689C|nr:putative pentatricopeptide repeat-containing protein At3g13770, mitochondrial [Selaginella moellendorffii]|eukprot:XP_024522709.1 putative pentatricopeptide repeat-containing protein At3g13770, mitochondrial [Selaginella moellendorffii]